MVNYSYKLARAKKSKVRESHHVEVAAVVWGQESAEVLLEGRCNYCHDELERLPCSFIGRMLAVSYALQCETSTVPSNLGALSVVLIMLLVDVVMQFIFF